MKNNNIEKYELIDGISIVDRDFTVLTANEQMYRFIGNSAHHSLISIIHQVDLDDFTEVCNTIKMGEQKSMVLRMCRCDNSYRWMLMYIQLCEHKYNSIHSFEYFKLNISDIHAMKLQNDILKNNLSDVRHLLAMENELFFTYDYKDVIFSLNRFIDNEIHNIITQPIELVVRHFIKKKIINNSSIPQLELILNDIKKGKASYSQIINATIFEDGDYRDFEITGNTIYNDNEPVKSIGNIKSIDNNNEDLSIKTYEYPMTYEDLTYNRVRDFCENNIKYNPECNLTLALFEIKDINEIAISKGEEFVQELFKNLLIVSKNLVGDRGTVCQINNNLFSLAIRDLYSEIDIRAFILTLRNQIAWKYRLIDGDIELALYFGIAGYPNNGKDLSLINRKLVKALTLAENKKRDCFVIYKEYLHGELE